jgi:DNA invertase Pin-like site-specific DNA recombinase
MSNEAAMSPAIAYLRVSKEQKGKPSLGIEAQRAAVDRFARTHGFALAAEHVEIETGKGADALDRRPKLKAALDAAKRLKAPVIVAKLDRLSRDVEFISRKRPPRLAQAMPAPFCLMCAARRARACR